MHHFEPLFNIGPIAISGTIVTMWVIGAVIVLLMALGARNAQLIPGGLQNVVEMVVEGLHNFFCEVLGEANGRRYFPFLATLVIFILVSNYAGLLPGAGRYAGFLIPTASLSVTAAMAVIAFFMIQGAGFKSHGVGYFKHFIKPLALAPLFLMEEFIHPMSLSLRLYGNIMGEEAVVSQLFNGFFALAIPMQLAGLLFGLIQAMVFPILTAIYISLAASEGH